MKAGSWIAKRPFLHIMIVMNDRGSGGFDPAGEQRMQEILVSKEQGVDDEGQQCGADAGDGPPGG